MTTFSKEIKEAIESRVNRAQQGMVCLIENFDMQAMRADVKPLMAEKAVGNSDPVALPILPDIPVAFLYAGNFYIRPDYQTGDMVWVTFATRDIDESLKGNTKEESERTFDLSSASVAYGVAPTDWTPPTEFGDAGLLIGHKDGNAYIHFGASAITGIFGTKKVEWSNGGMRFYNGAVWTNFMTHTHAGVGLPPTPGT